MKALKLGFIFIVFACMSIPPAKANSVISKENKEKVKVYYFHNTRRCMTCNAVEKVTKEALKTQFTEELKDGIITFESLNIEEEEGKIAAKKLEVSGQALLFVSGDKKTDLTTAGFMNAVTKPEKLKAKIKDTVNSML